MKKSRECWNKFPVFLFLFLSVIISVNAEYNDIQKKSFELKETTTNETIENIKHYVDADISYSFHYHPQKLLTIWRTKEGDCTDQATVMKYMLETIYNKSLNLRFAHGYCNGYKHDWLRINYTTDIDNFDCKTRKFKGYGFW